MSFLSGWPERPATAGREPNGPGVLLSTGRFIAHHHAEIASVVALLLMAMNLISTIERKSITTDEFLNIPAGYFYLTQRDFRYENEHPPLVKMWSGVPLLFLDLKNTAPASGASPSFYERRPGAVARQFWKANRAGFQSISFWARVPMIIITLALAALIFTFAKSLFGWRAAMLSVVFFSFEPTMLAHGRVACNDVAAALAYLLFFTCLLFYLPAPTLPRALLVGLVTGLALVTKFSMVVLAPVLLIVLLFLLFRKPRNDLKRATILLQSAAIALVALLTINAAYCFQHASPNEWEPGSLMLGLKILSPVVPPDFLIGLVRVHRHLHYGHPASLLGQYSTTGWWYYFPVAFALKTSLPFLILSVASLAWALWRLLLKRDRMFLAVVVPLAIYAAVAMTSSINIGIRHLLPVFPFLFILGGAFLDRVASLCKRRVTMLAVLALPPAWMALEAIRAYPDYMSYLNQLAWRHPRWYYLSDSNIEWGDDVADLAKYLKARGETEVRAALAGWTLPYYGVRQINFPGPAGQQPPATRYTAIGASLLNGSTVQGRDAAGNPIPEEQRVNLYASYRNRTPEAVFGNSIYLYRENLAEKK